MDSGKRGYLKECRDCGRLIYLHQDKDGVWRPFESWVAGDAAEGEFLPHVCGGWVGGESTVADALR